MTLHPAPLFIVIITAVDKHFFIRAKTAENNKTFNIMQ